MVKKCLVLIILLLGTATQCLAGDFSTTVQSLYTVTSINTLEVTHQITITNQADTRYPTNYELLVRSASIQSLKVTTDTGIRIEPTQNRSPHGTYISFRLPNPIIGKGKSQTYTMTYQENDSIIGNGSSATIGIPPLGIDNQASTSATITLASSRCPNPYSSPQPTTTESANGITRFTFSPYSPTSSLLVRCSNTRYTSIQLNYLLENTNMTPIETQITLPPDTNYQQFEYETIEPSPLSLTTDTDGNVIATYKLEPKEVKRITVSGKGEISLIPNHVTWPSSLHHAYLSHQPMWPVQDPELKKISSTSVRQILQTIESTSMFDSSQTKRNGGKQIIHNPHHFSGQDYVDTFITLARSSGIMSRRLVGYTGSVSKLRPQTVIADTLHTWVDYYDTATAQWVQYDPTWSYITQSDLFSPIQDLNHIVLAINGISDTNPYPAGYYFSQNTPAPEITLTDSEPFSFNLPELNAKIASSWLVAPKLVLTNRGRVALYQESASITVGTTSIPISIDRLPIGGQVIIPLVLPKSHDQITLTIKDKTIPVDNSGIIAFPFVAVTGIMVTIAGIIAIIARRLLVSRRRQ